MGKVLVMANVPSMSFVNLGNEVMPKFMKQNIVGNTIIVKPIIIQGLEKYFDNMQTASKQVVGLTSLQCANDNLRNFCMVGLSESLISVIEYTSEVSKFYTELDEMCYGQSLSNEGRELYRELCEMSLQS